MSKPLTLPVAPRVPLVSQAPARSRGPLPPPLRQQERLSRPKSAFHRHVLRLLSQAAPATDPTTLPPWSGFRRAFALRCSRTEKLDPQRLRGQRCPGSRGPCAACRLLQSKRSSSTTAGSIKPRSPCPGPPPSTASNRPSRPLSQPQEPAGRVALLLSKLGQPRGHRSGAKRRGSIQHPLLPPRFLTMEAYPQPDRLEHLLSQTRFDTGMENPAPRSLPYESLHELARQPHFRSIAFRTASRTPSRKEMRSAASKVPSINGPPLSGWAPYAPPAVSSLANALGIRRLFVPACSPARQRQGTGKNRPHRQKITVR